MNTTTSDNTGGYYLGNPFSQQHQCFRCGQWILAGMGHDALCAQKCYLHFATIPCQECERIQKWNDYNISRCNPLVPTVAANDAEEPEMSMIDERQVEVLDGFRAARDTAKRHAQTKVDRATLMKIQAEALIAEARELVAEINEETPYPNETGADIGPIPGAGGSTR